MRTAPHDPEPKNRKLNNSYLAPVLSSRSRWYKDRQLPLPTSPFTANGEVNLPAQSGNNFLDVRY